ncbi:DUF2769 domain-containing protein [Methanobacterium petrolearium]|uniref:DUF2769 domain-containing protein n=1 Tax=Methanobacterium petrolearium TaxID=710190 RepID=UPI001FD72BD3|nr:DUF2769 domain-containing protein [Methanobacterium petrolearium]
MENLEKCLCDCCPVQNKSRGVLDKMKIIEEISQDDLDSRMMIEKERIPAIYCAGSNSTVKDLNSFHECQCEKCMVWKENNLFSGEPAGYFCRDGKFKQ